MIRCILAALDGSESGRSAGKYAAHLALRMDAGLEALNVIDARSLEGPTLRDFTMHLGLEPFETYTQALREVLETQAREVISRFKEDAAELGLPESHITPVIEIGIIAETICTRALKADLVVMGQHGEHRTFSGGLLGSASEQIVRRAARPVMVCPPTFAPIQRPLLAYDGSEPADNALHLANDFASQLGTGLAVLIAVDGEQMTEEHAHAVRSRAEDYLAHCCLETEITLVEGHAEEQIIEHAAKEAYDLIIMGAFGRGRIRELIVGSTTEYVMRKSTVPVMLTRV